MRTRSLRAAIARKIIQNLNIFLFENINARKRVMVFQEIYFEQCTEVRFANFLSGQFSTEAMNPPDEKCADPTSVYLVTMARWIMEFQVR